jgi:hypothetical protein
MQTGHIVLICSSLLSVRNCEAERFGDVDVGQRPVHLIIRRISRNSLLPEAVSRLTVISPVFFYTAALYWENS